MFSEENPFIEEVVESDESDNEDSNSEEESGEDGTAIKDNEAKEEQLMINIAYTQYPIVKEWAKIN